MLNLPKIVIALMDPFAACFYGVTTRMNAQNRLIGAILTPGKRVVSEAVRVMGLQDRRKFAQYHQVLSRAVWSPFRVARNGNLRSLTIETINKSSAVRKWLIHVPITHPPRSDFPANERR